MGLTRDANDNVKGFGDTIVGVHGVYICSADDAIFEIRRRQIGGTVTLSVDRNGARLEVQLPLVAKGSLSFLQS